MKLSIMKSICSNGWRKMLNFSDNVVGKLATPPESKREVFLFSNIDM